MLEEGKDDGLEVWLSKNVTKVLVWVFVIAVGLIGTAMLAYFGFFLGPPLNIEPATLGQAGDYFGGILNPALSFLSVFALLVALVLQTRELKVSQEELRLSREEQAKAAGALTAQNKAIQRQSFEQTFFSWLASYGERLGEIEIVVDAESGVQRRGRRALYSWWKERLSADPVFIGIREDLDRSVVRDVFKKLPDGKTHPLQLLPTDVRGQSVSNVMDYWESLYREWQFYLDSLFRDIYRLLLWIDSQKDTNVSPAQKWLYVSIVRGKLSWIELVYLFFNAQTPRGASFKRLMEKYAILDNLTFDSDCVLAFLKEHPGDSVGYSDSAYCSVTARRALGLPDSAEEVLALASGN